MRKLCVSVEQAAKLCNIGRNAAYRAARDGTLPTVRFGKRILIPLSALEARLLEQAGAAAEVSK